MALVEAVRKKPDAPETPEELDLDRIKAALPGMATVSLEVMAADSTSQLVEKATSCRAASLRDFTHLGVAVCDGMFATGQPFWVVVIIGSKMVPRISPELINRGQREFHAQCHHCGEQYLARLHEPSGKHTGSLSTVCHKCNRLTDLYGIDTSKRYHRPPWFLRGFRPKDISSPLTAWLYVLSNCRYVDDTRQYGRPEVWQLARETYRMRQGDCEDTSILLADWLAAAGYKARVVIGEEDGTGHAWVVVHGDGHDYILETTGGRRSYRRVPPRSTVTTSYIPHAQFDLTGIWFRTSDKWTSDYHGKAQWSRGPWPLERVAKEKNNP
jgi:hypothetical protein